MALTTFPLKLSGVKQLTPGVKHFQFVRTDEQAFPFIPGQFITLHIDHEGKKLRRSYSIASLPGKENTIDFAASYVEGGPASELLFNLNIGAVVEASGPTGRLVLREEDHPQRFILIATGTGTTPYRSMLVELEQRILAEQTQIVVMQGVRRQEDLLYGDDFLALAQKHPEHFTFGAYYSREEKTDLHPHEHTGYICKHLASLNPNPQADIVYLCGNPNMIDEAYEILKGLGFDASRVRREKYISAGV